MSVQLATKYLKKVDELFAYEPKSALVTNEDFDWTGAHTVMVYKISTAPMNDYQRVRVPGSETESEKVSISRYGNIDDLSATTEEMVLKKDRSFIFNIDRLDEDETATALNGAKCLARQLTEVVLPERDKYIFEVMVQNAGLKGESKTFDTIKLYESIIDATAQMDEANVPDTDRTLIVTPKVYAGLKTELQQVSYNERSEENREKGVIGYLDGMAVVKVPSNLLPKDFGYMIAHKSACVAPVKLEDYNIHMNTPLSSGAIVTGRVCYDAFVLDNKKKGIFYQEIKPATTETPETETEQTK